MIPPWLKIGFEVEKEKTSAWFKQVHGRGVVCLDGPSQPRIRPPEADAGFTRDANKPIWVYTADCLPVLLAGDTPEGPIAAIHCGWRGALAGVVSATLDAWDFPRQKTRAIFGPGIRSCCFEVKQDFIEAFEKAGKPIKPFLQSWQGRWFCDLAKYVQEVELAGVASVTLTPHRCTVCSAPGLPSYRRSGKAAPSIRSWILKNDRPVPNA